MPLGYVCLDRVGAALGNGLIGKVDQTGTGVEMLAACLPANTVNAPAFGLGIEIHETPETPGSNVAGHVREGQPALCADGTQQGIYDVDGP